jgi:hypothetical protein
MDDFVRLVVLSILVNAEISQSVLHVVYSNGRCGLNVIILGYLRCCTKVNQVATRGTNQSPFSPSHNLYPMDLCPFHFHCKDNPNPCPKSCQA